MGKPNIVYITIDACRAQALGCYGFSKNVSPHIDALAKKGLLCKQAFSSHTVTDHSRISLLGGRHLIPEEKLDFIVTQEVIDRFFGSGGKFLQEYLQEAGYQTHSFKELKGWRGKGFDAVATDRKHKKKFVQGVAGVINKIPLVSSLAKHVFYKGLPKKMTDSVRRTVGGEQETNDAVAFLKKQDGKKPFFMYLEYKSAHMPYAVDEPFASQFKEDDDRLFFDVIKERNFSKELLAFYKTVFDPRETMAGIIGRYYGAIAYIDSLVGRVVGALDENGLRENTIVVVTADHGESLVEHDIFFEHYGLYDVTTQVPLIFSGKGFSGSQNGLVQLEDVVPTLLKAVGVAFDADAFDGSDVASGKGREFVFMEESFMQRKQALRDGRYKLIMAPNRKQATCVRTGKVQGGVVELYDLVADPSEEHSLVKEKQDVVVRMATRLRQTVDAMKMREEKRRIAQRLRVE